MLIRDQWFSFFIHQTCGNSGRAGCGSLKVSSPRKEAKFIVPLLTNERMDVLKSYGEPYTSLLGGNWERESRRKPISLKLSGGWRQEAWRIPWEFPGLRISRDSFPCSLAGTVVAARLVAQICVWMRNGLAVTWSSWPRDKAQHQGLGHVPQFLVGWCRRSVHRRPTARTDCKTLNPSCFKSRQTSRTAASAQGPVNGWGTV